MAELTPVTQEFRFGTRQFTDKIGIIVKHLSALRDELLAHDAAHGTGEDSRGQEG